METLLIIAFTLLITLQFFLNRNSQKKQNMKYESEIARLSKEKENANIINQQEKSSLINEHQDEQNKLQIEFAEDKTDLIKNYEEMLNRFSDVYRNQSELQVAVYLEKIVRETEISKLSPHIINNTLIETNSNLKTNYRQLDHVILTTKGIVIIETKHWHGKTYIGLDNHNFPILKQLNQLPNKSAKFGYVLNLKEENNDDGTINNVSMSFYTNPFNQVRGAAATLSTVIKKELDKDINIKNMVYFHACNENIFDLDEKRKPDIFTTYAKNEKDLKNKLLHFFNCEDELTVSELEQIKQIFYGTGNRIEDYNSVEF